MKNTRTVKYLGLVFLLLLVIVLIPSFKDLTGKYFPKQTKGPIIFSTYAVSDLSKVSIRYLRDDFELIKDSDSWRVASYSASKNAVNDLFDALKTSEVVRQVSKNPENHKSYGVASDSAVIVTLQKSDGMSLSFLLGNSGPETGSFYIRLPDDDVTYIGNGNLKDTVKLTVSDWREKTITDIDKEKVSKIEVTGLTPFQIVKNSDKKWEITVGSNKKVLEDGDSSLPISQLMSLTALGFGTEVDRNAFEKGKTNDTVTFLDSSGSKIAVLTIVRSDTNWLVMRDGSDDIYTISETTLSDFFKFPEKAR